MSQHYSNQSRESDPHALPDIEVFYQDGANIFDSGFTGKCEECGKDGALADGFGSEQNLCLSCAKESYGPGYYWWWCLSGCLPDGDAIGPFETEDAALEDARSCS